MAHQNEPKYPEKGEDWTEDHWRHLLEQLIKEGVVSWCGVTSAVLGGINPSQVGTSIASKASFQRHFPARQCWAAVRAWHFLQSGTCADCGTRLDLQADHAVPREFLSDVGLAILQTKPSPLSLGPEKAKVEIGNRLNQLLNPKKYGKTNQVLVAQLASDLYDALISGVKERKELENVADRLDNMVLRCRRHNVIRRPSHANGGMTFLTAEAGLMWLLFVHRPTTYEKFHDLCRDYGLTMANIRFEEAWAMARWLNKVGIYKIDQNSKYAP
jgi:5-methylcytosine-specific restriction endonuclease McrA